MLTTHWKVSSIHQVSAKFATKGNDMASLRRLVLGMGLIAVGYVLGSHGPMVALHADDAEGLPSDEAVKKIVEANDKLKAAVDALKLESRYESATKSVNP